MKLKSNMKIPEPLHQFKDEDALIVVSGRQDAAFYEAQNGILTEIDSFKIPTPHYSDHEGEIRVSSRGAGIRSGGTRELRHQDIIRDFMHEFKRRIKKLPATFSKIYVFAPHQTKNKISDILFEWVQRKADTIIEGNFYYHHPLKVIGRISGK